MRVSVTQLKDFKACRRSWFFKYCEGLEPVKKSDALTVGSNYHSKLEELYKHGVLDVTEPTKEMAMALAYGKYIFPKLECQATEEWIERPIDDEGNTLIGRVDGIMPDGTIVEHKTTSADVSPGGEYEFNLQWDEQVLAYMYLSGTRKIVYTVCKKPTIRLKKDETDEQFFERMCAWYDEDTENKIRTFEVIRTDDEVQEWVDETAAVIKHMRTGNEPCYKNTLHCRSFGSTCPYQSICLSYQPEQEYVEFVRRDQK